MTFFKIHVAVSYMMVKVLINKTVIKYPWFPVLF